MASPGPTPEPCGIFELCKAIAAFNALLKTLEEPPPRVVFVLATTDPQRVPPTILSRCQRFDFRRIPLEAVKRHLQWIASKESIGITPEPCTWWRAAANSWTGAGNPLPCSRG